MERTGFLIFLFLLNMLIYCRGYWKVSGSCLDSERKALTIFRKALNDPSNILTSWDDEASGCCKWRGITCHNITGFVLKLHLYNLSLSGRIDPALVELKHLHFLDLSNNAFYGISIPQFLGSMKELRHLNLSYAGFSGRIPHQLGNLSKLISLQLSSSSLSDKNLWWLTSLPSLKYLDMSYVNLSMASHDWVHVMNMCPSLVELRFIECGLSYISPTLASVNFSTSLHVLDLYGNKFNSRIPKWIGNISSLVSLNLSLSNFHGLVPYQFSQLSNLEELRLADSLSANSSQLLEGSWSRMKLLYLSLSNMYGGIPNSIGNITSLVDLELLFEENTRGSIPRAITKLVNLEILSLNGYHMHAIIPDWLDELKNLKQLILANCMLTGPIPAALGGFPFLRSLYLNGNQLNGRIPSSLGGLSSLEELLLQENQLNGTIPTTLGKLSKLSELDLSYNCLTGNVSESLFENLKNLNILDLSSNSLLFDPHPDWAPPFQLNKISLGSCHLGHRFPPWLQTQKHVGILDLSNAAISDIIPTWFWDLTPQLSSLNLSNNEISGQLPNPLKMHPLDTSDIDLSSNNFNGPIPCILNGAILLDLSNNQFSGPIPPNFTSTMNDLVIFSAIGNQISGKIPSSIGKMKSLLVLDLSQNNISGTIPLRLGDCVDLVALDLSKNHLSGRILTSLGLLHQLQTLHLSNNSLSGKVLSSLKNCTRLVTLDLGQNNFLGHIPTWIGKSFPDLRILRLRSNMFTGNIPPQLFNITSLHVLDLGQNYLSGSIPQSLQNLMAMKNEQKMDHFLVNGTGYYYKENLLMSVKGQMLEYTRTISLVTCMDLSINNLSGEIPEQITSLLGLRVLNFSGNHLTGKIPNKIGKLVLLESLDFFKNQLSGTIPPSMSSLTFLSYLNLSNNNLSGKIPSGNQLRTLQDPSIYMGNNDLCGPSLPDKCDSDETSQSPMPVGGDVKKYDEAHEMVWFYSALAPGFAVGFWAFCGILVLKKAWRIAYYRFVDEMKERLLYSCRFARC
ncbi:receptor-like protein EIX2 [Magnolia sinica]|uniref:receptor-like protein EIX2 n=1 Tax=Magnolia sinica TaxID=86752 RepID=UPI00265A064B|nr:receptor-like protein EIX2 [Magnolia sinica]